MGIVIRETVINQGDSLILVMNTKGHHACYKVTHIDKKNKSILLVISQHNSKKLIPRIELKQDEFKGWYYNDNRGIVYPLIAKIIY